MVGVAAVEQRQPRRAGSRQRNAFFHSRSVANASTASASGRPACASAAANTAGSAARRNGLVARSSVHRRRHRRQARDRASPARALPLAQRRVAGLDRAARSAGWRACTRARSRRACRPASAASFASEADHLRRRAFEEPAAAAGEERVAGERDRHAVARSDVGDLPRRMARHVEHARARARCPAARIASPSATACVRPGIDLARRSEDRHRKPRRAARAMPPTWSAVMVRDRGSPASARPSRSRYASTGAASPGSTTTALRPVAHEPDVVVAQARGWG